MQERRQGQNSWRLFFLTVQSRPECDRKDMNRRHSFLHTPIFLARKFPGDFPHSEAGNETIAPSAAKFIEKNAPHLARLPKTRFGVKKPKRIFTSCVGVFAIFAPSNFTVISLSAFGSPNRSKILDRFRWVISHSCVPLSLMVFLVNGCLGVWESGLVPSPSTGEG